MENTDTNPLKQTRILYNTTANMWPRVIYIGRRVTEQDRRALRKRIPTSLKQAAARLTSPPSIH
jgi:hypothetical protein